jgi:NAD(P)-dependent dehydrogenase (short-subunit alcohol dehydrogenase family)
MAGRPRLLIAGGSGVFGRLLARELLVTTDAVLVLAGRDGRRAAAVCRALDAGRRATPLALDLTDPDALLHAAAGCFAVACTAGPFQRLSTRLPSAAVSAGAHWLDIADYAGWVLPLLADESLHERAAAAGLVVMPGLSSTPALSGALIRRCAERLPDARVGRVTLYIGNRNHKGAGAIASALGAGFAAPRPVRLPVGQRLAYRFDSPDAALLREELGLAVEFRVAFEWSVSNWLMASVSPLAGRLSPAGLMRLARVLAGLAAPLSRFGSDVGCVQAQVASPLQRASAALVGRGQRLAVLPCALAVEALLRGELAARGVVHPATWLAPAEWLARLERRGLKRFQATSSAEHRRRTRD